MERDVLLSVASEPIPRDPRQGRALDPALGLSAIGLGLQAGWRAVVQGIDLATVSLVVLHVLAGVLILVRRPAQRLPRARTSIGALALLLGSGLAVAASPSIPRDGIAEGVFVAGALVAAASIARLGRRFGVLPADRGLCEDGPYAWVRHPVYLGELIMTAALPLASGRAVHVVLLALVALSLGVRALLEERLLRGRPAYRAYTGRVRARLLPGVW